MSLQIHDCEQGSPEWFAVRAGIPTTSEFESLVKVLKSGKPSAERRSYMLRLAGEVLTGDLPENFTSVYTERGKALEAEAADLYAMIYDAELQAVGFMTNHGAGCSPDRLIGDDGMLEIKTKKPELLIDAVLSDDFLAEHKAQCQGALWIAEREWIDLCVYWPGLPPFIKRAYRDEEYIASLAKAVAEFNAELAAVVAAVRTLSEPEHKEAA